MKPVTNSNRATAFGHQKLSAQPTKAHLRQRSSTLRSKSNPRPSNLSPGLLGPTSPLKLPQQHTQLTVTQTLPSSTT